MNINFPNPPSLLNYFIQIKDQYFLLIWHFSFKKLKKYFISHDQIQDS
jgi:hypothetical protein